MMKKNIYYLILLLFVASFTLLTFNFNSSLMQSIDSKIIAFVQSFENKRLTTFIVKFTDISDTLQTTVLTIVAVIILFIKKFYKQALFFGFTLLTGGILLNLVKKIVHRPRPAINRLAEETSFSFPSGHTMAATMFYSCLAIVLIMILKNKLKYFLILLPVVMVPTIALTRIYLGVHYPTDTLAGFLFGTILVMFFYSLFFKTRLIFKNSCKK